jgi:hypothetical protein
VAVSIWRQAESITVHLVNLTNPMTMRGPYREIIPIGEQTVHARIPPGCRVKGVSLLRAGIVVPWQPEDGWVNLAVPQIADHEVVALGLEG